MASRRGYLRSVVGLACAGGGCVARRTGTSAVHARVGAAPNAFDAFATCRIAVTGVAVDPHDGSYETYDVPTTTVDLAAGEGPWPVADVDLPADGYERIRFEVGGVVAALSSGDPVPVTVPGLDTLTVGEPFRVRSHVGTTLTAVLTVVEAEATERYGLRAVPDLLRVSYTDGPGTPPLTAADDAEG